jgi:hypothetical protein
MTYLADILLPSIEGKSEKLNSNLDSIILNSYSSENPEIIKIKILVILKHHIIMI